MRLEAIALASSANSLRHRQLERRRRERRDAAARARLLRFRASCADDMCCGLVVMVGAMVLAAGGSWLVPSDSVRRGAFEEITALAKEAVALVQAARP